jgi:hypothetical protein
MSEEELVNIEEIEDGFCDKSGGSIYWKTPGLKVTKLYLIGTKGACYRTIMYCHGVCKSGKKVDIRLPFNTVPRVNASRYIQEWARRDGVSVDNLGILKCFEIKDI